MLLPLPETPINSITTGARARDECKSDGGRAVALELAMVAHSHELPLINTHSHHAPRPSFGDARS